MNKKAKMLLVDLTSSCLKKCNCIARIKVIDCSNRGLAYIPAELLQNYTNLIARDNNLLHVNFTRMIFYLPQLRLIDLRGNPSICSDVFRLRSSRLKVISDCDLFTKLAPTTSTTLATKYNTSKNMPTSVKHLENKYKLNTSNETETTDISNIPSSDPGTGFIIYMTVVITTILLIPFIILCSRGVVNLFKSKRCRISPPISYELTPFYLENSEEHVIFDVTAL